MASTSSPNLKLELIGTGEQQGTWGSTTNTNLGTLLEEAIGGYAAVAMADADQTLTMTPYVSATARNMTLEFTGALTGTRTVNISAALEKIYVVKNSTTGGFPVTFKVTGLTGVSIPNGQTMIVYADGTDIRQASLPVSSTNASQIDSIELGNASDTTITRSSAGVIAVEGVTVPLNSITNVHTALRYEVGNATDTTITRTSAGAIAVEGVPVALNSTTLTHVALQYEVGNATDTTITRSAAGVIAVEGGVVPLQNRANTFTALQTLSNANLTMSGTTATTPQLTLNQTSGFTNSGILNFERARAGPSSVGSGDVLGTIYFSGENGAGQQQAALISAIVTATPSSDMPGRLNFSTTPVGSIVPSLAMNIDSSQQLLIGYGTSNGAYKLQVNSQIAAANGAIYVPSDIRYKDNITTITDGLDIIMSLNPVQFSWKSHPVYNFDRRQPTLGFIAQEVQGALVGRPYLNSVVKSGTCTIEEEKRDEEGNLISPEVTEEFLGLSSGEILPILVKALQELKEEFDSYKAAHP